jgi:hypothetical protein
MTGMWTQFLTAFQGFFSRSFWLGSFLPLAIFAAIHLVIAWIEFPQAILLPRWVMGPTNVATIFPLLALALIVLAYTLTPLIPMLRGLLDGSLLPAWMHDALHREHAAAVRKIRQQINDATDAFDRYGLLAQSQLDRLWNARRRGAALGRMGAVAAIERATREIDPLARQFEKGTLPQPHALERAATALAWALRRNSADLGNADSRKLDRQQLRLINLLGDVEVEAKHRLDTLNSRHRPVAIDNPQATRMADARLVTEQYSYQAYRADFDFIWQHIQLVLTDKDPMTDRVIAGQSQLDFAVLSLALAVTVPLVWLPLLAAVAHSPWLFLAIGIATPLVFAFLYRLVIESQVAFGEIVKITIDRCRLNLLGKLNQPVPATLAAERELWDRLRLARTGAPRVDLTYQMSKQQPAVDAGTTVGVAKP